MRLAIRSRLDDQSLSRGVVSAALPSQTIGYWLVVPALAIELGLLVYPIVYDFALSLTGAHEFAANGPFVGLANFTAILGDGSFWLGVRFLAFWVPITLAVELILGLATALLLWWRFWGRTLLFVAVFVPWAFPSAFSAFAWYALFVPPFIAFYVHQAVLMKFWLDDHFGAGTTDFLAYSVMSVWRVSSIMAIFLLAGLNAIPRDLIDYARLEAGSLLRLLWHVIIPLLRRYLVLVAMIGALITFIDFDSIYLESGDRTIVPVFGTLAYMHGIMFGDTGYAAAVNVISVPALLLVAVIGLRWIGPDRLRPGGNTSLPPSEAPLAKVGVPAFWKSQPPSVLPAPLLPWRWRRRLLYAVGTLAAISIAAFHLLPVYFIYNQAVVPVEELHLGQPFLVYHPDFSNFVNAFQPGPLWTWARNTLLVFGSAIVLGGGASLLAGYGLARFQPRGADLMAKLAFACLFLPQFAIIVPLYQLYNWLGLDNSLRGLTLIYMTMVIPFSTWLFYAYFQGMDPSVEEHAWLDADRRTAFLRVVLPMCWPVCVAAALFSLGILGSDVVYGSTLALSNEVKTLPVGLGLSAISLDEWANVSADMLAASMPLILLCAALGRSFVQGIQAALLEGA